MPELPLDDGERDAFVGHLYGVRVPELVRSDTPPMPALAAVRASCLRAADASQCRPAVAPLITHNTAPTGSDYRTTIHGSNCDQDRGLALERKTRATAYAEGSRRSGG